MRIKLNSILCTTDFSAFSNETIPYGVAMAKEFGSKLYVGHVIEMHTSGLYGEAQFDPMELKDRHTDFIEDQCTRLMGGREVEWTPLIGTGHPPDEIRRMAENHQVGLVITATHGRSGIKRFILGSVTERLMRTLSCPLLVVVSRREKSTADPERRFRMDRIMVGCDFSSDSSLAFQHALSFAQEFQSALHLVHVVDPSSDHRAKGGSGTPKPSGSVSDDEGIRDRLMAMVPEEATNWCTPVTTVLSGRPDIELARYARLYDMDMIFLGIRGHGLIETYLVGSTTERIVRQLPCPVLAARPVAASETTYGRKRKTKTRKISGLEGNFGLFSAEGKQASVLIRLKSRFMEQATDLAARDSFLTYLDRVSDDGTVKTVTIVGSPDKIGKEEYFHFYDRFLKAEKDLLTIHRLFNVIDQILLALVNLNKIIIHADSGAILPLYFNLSLACDYRIVADNTVFQNPCLEMGMIPKGGGPFFLSRMMGIGKAYEILLADEDIAADQALEMGIVDQVVPENKLLSAAFRVSEKFKRKPGASLKGIKRLLNHSRKGLKRYLELENQELLSIVSASHHSLGH